MRLLTEGVWDQQGWDMIGRPVAYEPVGKGYAAAPGQQVPDYFLAPFPDAKVEGVTGGQDLNIGQTLLNSGAGCGGSAAAGTAAKVSWSALSRTACCAVAG